MNLWRRTGMSMRLFHLELNVRGITGHSLGTFYNFRDSQLTFIRALRVEPWLYERTREWLESKPERG